jgi:alanine dehydrogenase
MKYFFHNITREELFTQESLYRKKAGSEPIVIGIPKENMLLEPRVPFTPEGVQILIDAGYEVIIESGAGKGINYSDHNYSESGAFITDNKALVFSADVVFKIIPPTVEEAMLMKEKATIFSFAQLNYFPIESLKVLQHKKTTAIAYDFMKDENHNLSVLDSIHEIEGNVVISVVSELMSNQHGGKGLLLGGISGISPTEIVMLGAGSASVCAAKIALTMGCCVKVFDHDVNALRKVREKLGSSVFTSIFHPRTLEKSLISADAIVGSLRYMNGEKRYIVSEDAVKTMKKGSVIVDISIDQGGSFETSICTTISKPYYVKYGVIHCCLPNISALVARTTSMAVSNALTRELGEISADGGILNSIKRRQGFCNGVYLYNGILTNAHIGSYFGLLSNDINLLLTTVF